MPFLVLYLRAIMIYVQTDALIHVSVGQASVVGI